MPKFLHILAELTKLMTLDSQHFPFPFSVKNGFKPVFQRAVS